MSTDWRVEFGKFTLAIALGGVTVTCWESMVLAQQIIPDETLGAERSVVRPDRIKGLESDRISGGAVRGSNLFHSFRSFNIGEGQGGYFENPAAIENIFSRVTGSNASNILGTLGVLGDANLFFLNPNGILFGPNASLDVRGSFLATTADSIIFPDGNQFSATNPEAPPILTVNVKQPIGLQFEGREEVISNQGNLAVGEDFTLSAGNLNLQGQLQTGKDLTLQATDTVKIWDSATQPSIAAAGGQLLIQGNQSIDIFALNHPDSGLFSGGDLVLRSANPVGGDAHYWTGGSFRIEQLDGSLGDLFSLYDPIIRSQGDVSFFAYLGTSLHILAGGSVNLGTVVITGPGTADETINPTETPNLANVTLSDGTSLFIDGNLRPTLDVRAGMNPAAIGDPLGTIGGASGTFFDSSISPVPPPTNNPTATSADITIGDVSINSPNSVILLTNQYEPNSSLTGGDITVTGAGLFGIGIDARGFGGNGGNVIFDSRGRITLNSTVDASANSVFDGDGGNVTLLANGDITLNPSTSIFSNGLLGGNITLRSDADISVTGTATRGLINSNSFGNVAGTTGGDISIIARSLSLTNGAQVEASPFGQANAGSVIIQTSDSVSLEGVNSNGVFSAVGSQVLQGVEGNAGNVTIETERLKVANGAQIRTDTFSSGNGGDLKISATEVELNTASGLFTTVQPQAIGNGGSLRIDTEHLQVINEAQVQTSTFGSGNGGDLMIVTEHLQVADGAQILARTFGSGNAGELTVIGSEVEVIGSAGNGQVGSILSTQTGGTGNAGNLSIETGRLIVRDGSSVLTATTGEGQGGNLTVTATEFIEVVGTAPLPLADGQFFNSSLLTDTFSRFPNAGDAGDLTIKTERLIIQGGAAVSASTLGRGQGGELRVTAPDSIELMGTRPDGSSSALVTEAFGKGDAGNIIIKTGGYQLKAGQKGS